MTEILGFIGALCFIVSGLPQLIKVLQTKSVKDLSVLFLWLWMAGEIFMVAHLLLAGTWTIPLMVNYGLSGVVVILLIISYYRYKK